jgi:VWFA-related protein
MKQNKVTLKEFILVVVIALTLPATRTFAQEGQKEKPQQPEEVIRVYTNLVQTDVTVFDKQGRFVNGLKREDFSLSIDGKTQPIEFFDRVAAGSADEEAQLAAARGVPSKGVAAPVPLDRGRAVFFYVDDFHLSAGDLIFVRKALLNFIDNNLGQNDEAVIASASGQIGFLQQLTDNKVVLHAAIERIKARPYYVRDTERPPMTEYQALLINRDPVAMDPNGIKLSTVTEYFVQNLIGETQDQDPRGYEAALLHVHNRAQQILDQAAGVTVNTLDGLKALIRSSSQLPGRKLVFLVSDGFFIDKRNSDTAARLQSMTASAARNGVVIYSLDARALMTDLPGPGDDVAIDLTGKLDRESKNELSASREAMEVLAWDTGGRTIFDTNALAVGLAKAVKETSVYYLLAWRGNHEDEQARKARRVEVRLVGRPDLTVSLRHGGIFDIDPPKRSRQATNEVEEGTEKPAARLGEAIAAMYPSNELPVALSLDYLSTPDKGLLLTASMQLISDSLSFTTEEGKEKAVVDLAGEIFNTDGKVAAHFKQQKRIATTLPNHARPPNQPLIFKYQASLPPGLYQIRVGARDEKSGKVGTVHQWIEIPDLSAHHLTLSSVIVGEPPPVATSEAQRDQNVPTRILLHVDHRFHRNSSLRFIVYVYNAALASADSKPDLVLQVQVLRDRQPIITTPLKQISTVGLQDLKQISSGADISLENLALGRYLLLITVIDRASKTSASQEMRFEVE